VVVLGFEVQRKDVRQQHCQFLTNFGLSRIPDYTIQTGLLTRVIWAQLHR